MGEMNLRGSNTIKDIYQELFKIGVSCEAISPMNGNCEIGNPQKEALIAKHFNSITFGNELKPAYNMGFDSPEATEEYLPFSVNPAAKTMLDWAKEHNMSMRGHVLVWHSQCSPRFFCKNYEPVYIDAENIDFEKNPFMRFIAKLDPVCFADRATLLKRLESYIHSLMEYMFQNGYAKILYAWDVVNEAIELDDKTPTGLRNSYWYRAIGEDFMYFAFKYAREAERKYAKKYASLYQLDEKDEVALLSIQPMLFYNDYNEWMPEKQDAIIAALQRETTEHGSIIGDNLIDGIGMQGHLSDNNNIKEYVDALHTYAKLVSEVHITELDVKQTCTNVNADYYQGVFYRDFFKALVEAKKEGSNLTSVTLWGLTDDNSWIHGANPLLFNGDLTKKLSYDGIVYALTGEEFEEPVIITRDLSDRYVDFEGDIDLEEKYFKVRGVGEMEIQNQVVHEGKAALRLFNRRGPWSGLNYDVSDFLGQTIEITAWIKSDAESVSLNADINGPWPILATVDTSSGEWTKMTATYKVPHNLYSLVLYFSAKDADFTKSNDIYLDDLSVHLVGLSEGFEEETNIAAIRGVGHLPHCYVTDKESVDGKGHSYCVTRQEKDATIKFSVTPYIGRHINVEAYIKTVDSQIKIGLDGPAPVQIASVASVKGQWTKVTADLIIPEDRLSADIYIETDGNADFYVDDIFVSLA